MLFLKKILRCKINSRWYCIPKIYYSVNEKLNPLPSLCVDVPLQNALDHQISQAPITTHNAHAQYPKELKLMYTKLERWTQSRSAVGRGVLVVNTDSVWIGKNDRRRLLLRRRRWWSSIVPGGTASCGACQQQVFQRPQLGGQLDRPLLQLLVLASQSFHALGRLASALSTLLAALLHRDVVAVALLAVVVVDNAAAAVAAGPRRLAATNSCCVRTRTRLWWHRSSRILLQTVSEGLDIRLKSQDYDSKIDGTSHVRMSRDVTERLKARLKTCGGDKRNLKHITAHHCHCEHIPSIKQKRELIFKWSLNSPMFFLALRTSLLYKLTTCKFVTEKTTECLWAISVKLRAQNTNWNT